VIVVRNINVIATNDAPVVMLSAGIPSYTENGNAIVVDANLTVSDVDGATLQSAVISIVNLQPGDELSFTEQLGISGVYSLGTGTLTLVGPSTPANYQTVLRMVKYRSTSDNPVTTPRQISIIVNDGVANSASVSKTVNVIAVNDAPVIVLSGGSSSYTEKAAAVAIDGSLTINDVDNGNLQGAVISITNPQTGDALELTSQLGIISNFQAQNGVLTLTGAATVAQYQTSLRSVTYRNTEDAPDTTPRSVNLTVNDGQLDSTVVLKTLNLMRLPVADAATSSTSTWDQVKDKVAYSGLSAVGSIGLAAFGIWATRRHTEKSWEPKEYRVANEIRKRLKLNLGSVDSSLGLHFLEQTNVLTARLLSEGYGDLNALIVEEPQKAMSILAIVISVLSGSGSDRVTWEKSRLCYDLVAHPLFCWPKYKYRPQTLTNHLAAILEALARADLSVKEAGQVSEGSVDLTSINTQAVEASSSAVYK
jgi:hypothetical protein